MILNMITLSGKRFLQVETIYGDSGEPIYVLMSGEGEADEIVKENLKSMSKMSGGEHNEQQTQVCISRVRHYVSVHLRTFLFCFKLFFNAFPPWVC